MTRFRQQMRWVSFKPFIYVGEQIWSAVQNFLDCWNREANMSSVLNRQHDVQSINTECCYSTTVSRVEEGTRGICSNETSLMSSIRRSLTIMSAELQRFSSTVCILEIHPDASAWPVKTVFHHVSDGLPGSFWPHLTKTNQPCLSVSISSSRRPCPLIFHRQLGYIPQNRGIEAETFNAPTPVPNPPMCLASRAWQQRRQRRRREPGHAPRPER